MENFENDENALPMKTKTKTKVQANANPVAKRTRHINQCNVICWHFACAYCRDGAHIAEHLQCIVQHTLCTNQKIYVTHVRQYVVGCSRVIYKMEHMRRFHANLLISRGHIVAIALHFQATHRNSALARETLFKTEKQQTEPSNDCNMHCTGFCTLFI